MKHLRLTPEERIYLGGMFRLSSGFSGHRWFMGDEHIQVIARLQRRGLVRLEPDYEGHEVIFTGDRKWADKNFERWHEEWLAAYKAKSALC